MKKEDKIQIIVKSFLLDMFSNRLNCFNKNELSHLCKCVDYNLIPDRIIANNEWIYDFVIWKKIDRIKLIRLITRNINIKNHIDLCSYNYTIKECKNLLKIYPHLFHELKIDINKISTKDIYDLLTIGSEDITEKIQINKYKFTSLELFNIIKANNFENYIMDKIDFSIFKDYHIVNIINNTGTKFLKKLDIGKLTARKWLEVLEINNELIEFCNFEKFKSSDIFNSVEFICMFPYKEYFFLIEDRNFKNELSSFGWQKLLDVDEEYFLQLKQC